MVSDVRQPVAPLDAQLINWFAPAKKPVHVLLTKADKLTRQAAAVQLSQVVEALQTLPSSSAQLFSAVTRQGVEEAQAVLAGWLRSGPDADGA